MDKSTELVLSNSDPWDRFVHPYLTLMSDSYMISVPQSNAKKYIHINCFSLVTIVLFPVTFPVNRSSAFCVTV